MFLNTVRSLLAMHPAGLSTEQLLWRLRNAGLRYTAEDILDSLGLLIETGEVAAAGLGRWRAVAFQRNSTAQSGFSSPTSDPKQPTLRAAPATVVRRAPLQNAPLPDLPHGAAADGDWRALLRYYAATQRQDPRGRVDQRADQHAMSWQLFRTDGAWWRDADLQLPLGTLPATFREALMRRPESVCSIGYPVAFYRQIDVPSYIPVLLLPATYRLTPTHLAVEPAGADPALNPAWLDLAARRSRWQREALSSALLPDGEVAELEAILVRLRNAMATLGGAALRPAVLDDELTPGAEGLRNAAAFFLPSDATFTRGAERDLQAMQEWTDEQLRGTALGSVLGVSAGRPADDLPPAGPAPLTERQHAAAAVGLSGPLTIIQGPPGTGKSTVILAMLSSVVLSGRSVLLASRNHQALDEVERRLADLVGDAPVLTRGRDGSGERDTSVLLQMRALAAGDARPDDSATDLTASVLEQARKLQAQMRAASDRTAAHLALSAAIERLDHWQATSPSSPPRLGWWSRLARLFMRRRRGSIPVEMAATAAGHVAQCRRALDALPASPAPDAVDALAETVAARVRETLRRHAGTLTTPTRSEALGLAERLRELDFNRRTRHPALTAEDCRRVLRHRPAWAVSTLSAPSRIPLAAGLFDYVVFDEASQCDIASALPLLGRARHAVVVGDPMQLGFIPQLSLRQEHALMDAAGLGPSGRHLVAQGNNSLFEFVRRRPSAKWHFLADQFRSAAEIVGYLNDEFYEGRLRPAQAPGRVTIPTGYKPGLGWLDVPGRIEREDGGPVNRAEAEAVVKVLTGMIRERGFTGSIGVLSPFNAQVALLLRRIQAELSEAEQEAVSLRVSTIDRFQGGEADVILFSLVVAEGVQAGTLGFYTRERRRVNVAISRARAMCLVVGDKAFVGRSEVPLLQRLLHSVSRTPKPRHDFDSEWERRLYEAMRGRGLAPIPQYPVAGRYLDFALDPDGCRLDVEVDGRRWHADPDGNRKQSDHLRDRALITLGWKIRRFWVHELADSMETCLDLIEQDLGRG